MTKKNATEKLAQWSRTAIRQLLLCICVYECKLIILARIFIYVEIVSNNDVRSMLKSRFTLNGTRL